MLRYTVTWPATWSTTLWFPKTFLSAMASAPSQTLWSSQDHKKELPCSNSHAHWKGPSTLQTLTNVRNIVECKVISRTKGGKSFSCHTMSAQRRQILKSTKSSIIYTLKQFKIKIKAEQLLYKQLSKIALLSTFPSSTHIKPRSGCRRPSYDLEYLWSWLAVGNGLPCNDFVWPIVPSLCSLLSLSQC